MDLKNLLLGIIMMVAGIICIYAYSKVFIKDMKIRKNAIKLTGKNNRYEKPLPVFFYSYF